MNEEVIRYHPVLTTLRLYAGWLLSCLFVVYAIGSFQELRTLPFESPLVREWVESPLILQVTFLTFLFLLVSTVHQATGRGFWKGIALTLAGFVVFAAFQMNT